MLFRTVTRGIVCHVGSTTTVGGLLADGLCRAGSKVLVVADPGVLSLGLADPCITSIKEAGYNLPTMFTDIVPDPSEASVVEAAKVAKDIRAEAVVGVGGGSTLDVAKMVAFLAHPGCSQSVKDTYGVGNCVGDRLPLIQIPTTAGTGSEVTPISILTTGSKEKMGVVSPQLLPDWAVLDGALTCGVDPLNTAATGIDAMVHAIEAYTSKLLKNPLSDTLAKEALKLLSSNIEHVCLVNGSDVNARSDMLLGSLYAGMAFANAPVAAVHALAYPIGSNFKVAHGLSNALMLPHVLEFNMQSDVARQQYAEIAPVVFPALASKRADAICSDFISEVSALSTRLGVELSLRNVGIAEGDIDLLASDAMNQTRLLQNNPVTVSLEDAKQLYTKAL